MNSYVDKTDNTRYTINYNGSGGIRVPMAIDMPHDQTTNPLPAHAVNTASIEAVEIAEGPRRAC